MLAIRLTVQTVTQRDTVFAIDQDVYPLAELMHSMDVIHQCIASYAVAVVSVPSTIHGHCLLSAVQHAPW